MFTDKAIGRNGHPVLWTFGRPHKTPGEEPPGKIFWKTVSSVIPSFRSFRRQEERHSSLALVGLYINGLNLLLLSDNTKLTPLSQRMLRLLLCCCSISSLFFSTLSSLVKIWVLNSPSFHVLLPDFRMFCSVSFPLLFALFSIFFLLFLPFCSIFLHIDRHFDRRVKCLSFDNDVHTVWLQTNAQCVFKYAAVNKYLLTQQSARHTE